MHYRQSRGGGHVSVAELALTRRKGKTMKMTVSVVVCLVCVFSGNAIGAVITTFDSDLEGWTSNTTTEITWTSPGGNPDGYARFDDATINDTYLIAPARYLGDWSGLVGTDISYDHNVLSMTPNSPAPAAYTVKISGPGNDATWTGATAPSRPGWDTVTVPILESAWTVNSGTWAGLLADVDNLSIRIEHWSNLDTAGVDNITLAIPEPATLSLLALGGLAMLRRRRR